ncbi:uncharacterized protein LOC134836744 [Culicoides brevitarsis]|uniref:uncharacterized protein LOC134836744 n=1 Tax=Culicoides brevitarsis TaxID=469753 RepID=UPI00307B90B2
METRSKASRQHRSLIEKLPDEVLVEIFKYLDSWSIRRCSEVCLAFFHLTLRPEFRKFFKLTISEDYLASNCGIGELFAPERRTIRTFDHLTLENASFKTLPFAKNFFKRLGEEIRKIQISESFFSPVIFQEETKALEENLRENILINFPNLEELSVDLNQTLEKIQHFPPTLKTISVNRTIYWENQKNYKEFLAVQKGLSHLEQLKFAFLGRKLNFRAHRIEIYEHLEMSDAVNSINNISLSWDLQINCNLLEHSIIEPSCITGFYIFENFNFPYRPLKKFPNLEEVSLLLPADDPCLGEHHETLDLSHVRKLDVTSARKTKCDICILQMISSFSGLTKLSFHGNLTEHQVRLIFNDLPKLQNFELVGRIPKNIFDSSKFNSHSIEKLKNLQELFIIDVTSFSETALSNDCLLKFAFLPNLKSLRLSGSNENDEFEIDGIRNLVRQCPNLSSFCSTDDAFTGEMVREMLSGWCQLDTLMLRNIVFDQETWNFAKANCRFLRYLSVSGGYLQRRSIFKNIPCLKVMKINGTFYSRAEYDHQDGKPNSETGSWTLQYSAAAYKFISREDEDFGYLRTDSEFSEDEYSTDEEE